MRGSRGFGGLSLVIGLMSGCGDSTGPSVPTLAELEGTWDLTAFVITTHESTPRSRDLVADGDQTQVLTVAPDHSFDLYACVPNVLCAHIVGTLAIVADSLQFQSTNVPPSTIHVQLTGRTLKLDGDGPGYFLNTDPNPQLLSSLRVFKQR